MLLSQLSHLAMNRGSKLALGSANFGLNYGLANEFRKVSKYELTKIISMARSANIQIIDTAQAYGDSEARVGKTANSHFQIVTKIGACIDEDIDENNVTNLVQLSRDKLKQSQLYAVMLHKPEVLLGEHGKKIISKLQDLKSKKIFLKLGISIYSPYVLNEVLELTDLDIIQVPFNIFDQRILSSGWADKLKENGTEIHARSVFLQGVLLMQRPDLHPYFIENWPKEFSAWFEYLSKNSNDATAVALGFALKQPWIDKVIVGVDNSSQLRQLIKIEKTFIESNIPCFESNDLGLIDPSKWKIS